MINVYFFCDVGCGVVNDNCLMSWLRNVQMIGGQCLLYLFSEKSWFEENIDKVRVGDFNFVGDVVEIQMSQYLFCKLLGGYIQFFCNCYYVVGLIVVELNFG